MKKKLAAARRRIENGDGVKEGQEEEQVRIPLKLASKAVFTAMCFSDAAPFN